eukprot:m.22117 g.22117  ORF g.22117 m.22117 type:complete len:266 (+) comp11204_c0_seq2:291-1088(+)
MSTLPEAELDPSSATIEEAAATMVENGVASMEELESEMAAVSLQGGSLSCAFRDWVSLPAGLGERYGSLTRRLDLSHNAFTSLDSIAAFEKLEELILDDNSFRDGLTFPTELPSLHTLSLNKNQLENIEPLLVEVKRATPNITFLSLLGNQACPNELTQRDESDYQRFRYLVLHHLPQLRFLDSRAVTPEEVKEGIRVGGYMKPVLIAAADEEPAVAQAAQANAFSPLPRDSRDPSQHHGTMSKCKYVYHGRHSEGNRFIRNNDL